LEKQISNLDHIAVLILTFNEEENIERTLEALNEFPEVIIIDSLSTDQTHAIASRFKNVRLVERPFDNLMNQWNFGHTLTQRNWILSLDADYSVSAGLVKEILECNLEQDAYYASFRYCIQGIPLQGSTLPPRPVLYNKLKCTYEQDGHAQLLRINGKSGSFKNPIFHDDRKSLHRWLIAQNNYTDQEIHKLVHEGEPAQGVDKLRMKTILAPFFVFMYSFVVKGGFLNGRKGVYYALQRMYAELLFLLKRLDDGMMNTPNKRNK
jgi:glycosyltransferase involved in cell wall biosynthesis